MTIAILIPLLAWASEHRTAAQAQQDFTGTWKIDRALSDAPALKDLDDLTYVISYAAPEMHVRRLIKEKKQAERTSELVYYADGRGENISFLFGNRTWKSKTSWVGKKLVSKFRVDLSTYQETWSVSADGKTLTVFTEIIGNSSNRDWLRNITPMSYRRVFQKTP